MTHQCTNVDLARILNEAMARIDTCYRTTEAARALDQYDQRIGNGEPLIAVDGGKLRAQLAGEVARERERINRAMRLVNEAVQLVTAGDELLASSVRPVELAAVLEPAAVAADSVALATDKLPVPVRSSLPLCVAARSEIRVPAMSKGRGIQAKAQPQHRTPANTITIDGELAGTARGDQNWPKHRRSGRIAGFASHLLSISATIMLAMLVTSGSSTEIRSPDAAIAMVSDASIPR